MIIREVTLPLRLVSLTNQREHWASKMRRARAQRGLTAASMAPPACVRASSTFVVTLARIAPCALDDDNLRAAAKSVRDGVADWLGIDDGDERIEWRYAQERGKPKEYACRIRIERKSA